MPLGGLAIKQPAHDSRLELITHALGPVFLARDGFSRGCRGARPAFAAPLSSRHGRTPAHPTR